MERGSLEIKLRWSDEAHTVPEAEVEVAIHEMLASQPSRECSLDHSMDRGFMNESNAFLAAQEGSATRGDPCQI
jgi:hypothetical protein